jgi:hypothetical protein
MNNTTLYILVFISICTLVYYSSSSPQKIENYVDGFAPKPMPEKAAEACKVISSEAENIKAEYDGQASMIEAAGKAAANMMSFGLSGVLDNVTSGGDNEVNQMTRNIINTDMSSEEITKIEQKCGNLNSVAQFNSIDNTMCKYCDTNLCEMDGVNQSNDSSNKQTCVFQAIVDIMEAKTESVEAQALAQALQKAEGAGSGDNSVTSSSCNVSNKDMSTRAYFESVQGCQNQNSVLQNNDIKFCGNILNTFQKNRASSVQECLTKAGVIKEVTLSSDTKLIASAVSDQTTEVASGASLGSLCSICIVCILGSVASGVAGSVGGGGGGGGGGGFDDPPPEY